jgi:predicted nucleic acid-binding protein
MENRMYMLDTTVFNHIRDDKVLASFIARLGVYVTDIQRHELMATPEECLRNHLLQLFEDIAPISNPAATFLFGVDGAGWGQASWNDRSGLFEKLLKRLKELDAKNPRKKKRTPESLLLNQLRDVTIAETAMKNGAILVTDDSDLLKVVTECGGEAITLGKLKTLP